MWVIFHNPIVLFGSVAQWSSIRQSQPTHCSASFLFVFILYLHELAFFVFDNEQLSSPFMRYTWITLYDFPFSIRDRIRGVGKGQREERKKIFSQDARKVCIKAIVIMVHKWKHSRYWFHIWVISPGSWPIRLSGSTAITPSFRSGRFIPLFFNKIKIILGRRCDFKQVRLKIRHEKEKKKRKEKNYFFTKKSKGNKKRFPIDMENR